MRRPLSLLAIIALIAAWAIPASAIAATTTAPSLGGGLLGGESGSSSGGGTGASGTGGTAEEEGAEGTESSKRAGTGTRAANEESSGFGSLPILFGMGGAAVLITAIALFILRDARRNAPVPEGALEGSARMSPAQARKRRSKAKAVKQQRKRNRPR